MNKQQLLDEILYMLRTVKEDRQKLQQIYDYFMAEIYEDEAQEEIPEKYKKVVSAIAENIDAGLICFLNPETLEIEDVPFNLHDDPDELEALTGETIETLGLKHQTWENCITIEPPDSHESFKIMEHFAQSLTDENIQSRLFDALNRKRPFANFKNIVENSEFRQSWFNFKHEQLEIYAWDIIQANLK